MVSDIWREIMTPSARDEGPYLWAAIAIGHAMLGAVLSWGGFFMAAVYWLAKERRDLRRGGALSDGIVDSCFVGLGIAYPGPIWWPMLIFGAVAAGLFVRFRNVV